MHLNIDKEDTMQTEPVVITAHSLSPGINYEMQLILHHMAGTFTSRAVFRTDGTGAIDTRTQEPIKGNYHGIRQMGLFETIEPLPDFRWGGYCRCTPPTPWNFELVLRDCAGVEIDRIKFMKRWLHPYVERTEIAFNDIRGTLFKPPGNGPFPSIIDMQGTGGGIQEQKGATLSSEGFCVFTLGYFQFKDRPENLMEVDLQYFLDAVEWFTSLPFTGDEIGIQGVSFGAALVNLIAVRSPKVVSVCSINGPHAMSALAYIKENGQTMGQADVDPEQFYYINDQLCYDRVIKHLIMNPEAEFELEAVPKNVQFRYVVSMDDLSTSSIYSAGYLRDKLRSSGHEVEMDIVPGGHLMEPPYFPHHGFVWSKFGGMSMAYGGEAALHGKSEIEVWNRTLDFFSRTLGTPTKVADWRNKSKM